MQKQCTQCSEDFEITESDRAFYKKVSPTLQGETFEIPLPTKCSRCREMRRMAWCNEGMLYKDTCQLCGKDIISQFAPGSPQPVYCIDCFWSDRWDRDSYGRDIDWSRSILSQIHELEQVVPRCCVNTDLSNENSEYTHHAGHERNCYMMFHTSYAEDCLYGYGVKKAKNCIDNHYCHESELCYECIDVHSCYRCFYCQDSDNCNDSWFLYDCVGCNDCLLCTGLRNKRYCVLNEQLTKEEYQERLASLNTGSYRVLQELVSAFTKLKERQIRKATRSEMTEDSLGDHLYRAHDARHCYDCSDIEHSRYCSQLQLGTRHCHDIYQFGIQIEHCYDSTMIGYNVYNCHFCYDVLEQCTDLLYCLSCHSTRNSFGCVALKQSRYCIFNKQYSQEEYEELLARLLKKMIAENEFGEHLPVEFSQSAYNETMAQMWYPLTKKQVEQNGWRWQEHVPFTTGLETMADVPDAIDAVEDSICNEILRCEECRRNYHITPKEFSFYRTQSLPVPRLCFQCRRRTRMQQRNPRQLWSRQCSACSKDIQTTYAPERPEKVLCEHCYLKEVY